MTFTGKARVALVTGGNRGLGKEVCRQLLARGFSVVLASRDVKKGVAAAGEIRASQADQSIGDRLSVIELDVSSDPSVRRAHSQFSKHYSHLDVLVNNAATMYDTWAQGIDVDLAAVHEALETNLFGAWRMIETFLQLLRKSGHGRIVNVSSESGSLANMGGGTPAYSVSKAALNALTRIVADELVREKILVNAVCPGWTATDMGGGGRPVDEGARSIVWAALLPDSGTTGGFFRDGRALRW